MEIIEIIIVVILWEFNKWISNKIFDKYFND